MKAINLPLTPDKSQSLKGIYLATAALWMLAASGATIAGADVTFAGVQNMVGGWITGSGGRVAATVALFTAIIAAAVTRKLEPTMVAVGIAVVASLGTGIVQGIVGATI